LLKNHYHPTRSCITFENAPKSARPIIDSGTIEDSITFYRLEDFQRQSLSVKDSEAALWWGTVGSYVITGNSSWSVFGGHHYAGDVICVSPENPSNELPTFVPDVRTGRPPIKIDFIFSAKKGCEKI